MIHKWPVLALIVLFMSWPLVNVAHAQSTPTLSIAPSTVAPDGNVQVTGAGFAQNAQLTVLVSFTATGNGATQMLTLPVTTDANGAFTTALHVPIATTPKAYTVHVSPSGSQSDLATAALTVVAGITLTPAVVMTGTPSSVSVSGTGFGANEQVQIGYIANLVGGGTTPEQTTATSASDGSFTDAQLPVPGNAAPGFTSVAARGQTSTATASTQLEIVHVALNSATIGPGGTTAVTGLGFTPNTNLVVYTTVNLTAGGTQQIVTPATVDGSGNIAVSVTVPQAAAAGNYTVHIGTTVSSSDLARATLTVAVPPPSPVGITLTPSNQKAGNNSNVVVHGTGFGAGEAVAVSYTGNVGGGGTTVVRVVGTTDGSGAFSLSLPVPASIAAGSYTVTATGTNSHATATATLIVSGQPTVTLSPTSVRPGQTVTVVGSNFVPNQPVSLSMVVALNGGGSTTVSGTVTADGSGNVSGSLVIPGGTAPGTFTLTASQTPNGATYVATTTATVTALVAHITLSSTSVRAGQTVTVAGTGFGASEAVAVNYTANLSAGGTAVEQVGGTSDTTGSFAVTLPVPTTVAAGNYTVTATGASTHVSATALLGVTAQSTLSVSSTTVRPGQSVTITGHNFGPNAPVTVSATIPLIRGGSTTISATGNTDGAGNVSLNLMIPGGSRQGTVTFGATQQQGAATDTATLTITILSTNAQIALSTSTVHPGQVVTIQGTGFSSHASITLSATFALYGGGSRTVTSAAQTDNSGAFTAQLRVPMGATSGSTTVRVAGPASSRTATLQVQATPSTVSVAPAAAVPGSSVSVQGHGYLPNTSVGVSVRITLTNGSQTTLQATVTADAAGNFVTVLAIPTHARSGSYQLAARSFATGQVTTATLGIIHLTPSIVVSPASTTPGSQVTVQGFGWALGAHVTLSIGGQAIGQATSGANGTFAVKVTIPNTLSSRTHTITAFSGAGRKASVAVAVSRQITTHFYFGSLYTGHLERLAMLNATSIRASVTVTYQRTSGAAIVKTFSIPPHTRYTRDVNADLGNHVSAAASVASDVPIAASRVNYQGTDGAVSPGSPSPSTLWYFANGNTSHGYSEYLAIQNPNPGPVQVRVQLLPTHRRAFTVVRTMAATSRITLKLNHFVTDAVGVIVRSNGPVVVNRTTKIHQGIDSKNGVTTPHTTWYFAAGPRDPSARNWIAAINPTGQQTYVTVRAYDSFGARVGRVGGWLKPYARVGYLMNKVAGRTDVAVVVTASRPVVTEQLTYAGSRHHAETDTFGVPQAGTSRAFPALDTRGAGSHQSSLDLFNPSGVAIPVVVQFMTPAGATTQRTFLVNPLSHQHVDVGSVVPNAQVGAEVTSSGSFVAMARTFFDNRQGASTSTGSRG